MASASRVKSYAAGETAAHESIADAARREGLIEHVVAIDQRRHDQYRGAGGVAAIIEQPRRAFAPPHRRRITAPTERMAAIGFETGDEQVAAALILRSQPAPTCNGR